MSKKRGEREKRKAGNGLKKVHASSSALLELVGVEFSRLVMIMHFKYVNH